MKEEMKKQTISVETSLILRYVIYLNSCKYVIYNIFKITSE